MKKIYKKAESGKIEMTGDFSVIVDPYILKRFKNNPGSSINKNYEVALKKSLTSQSCNEYNCMAMRSKIYRCLNLITCCTLV